MGLQEWQVRPLGETRQVQAGALWGGAEAGAASARCQVVTPAGPRPVGRGERSLLPGGLPAPLWDSASPPGGGRGPGSPTGEGTHRRAAGGRFSLGSSGLLLGPWPWLGAGVLAGRKGRQHTSTCRGRPRGDPASSGPLQGPGQRLPQGGQGPIGTFTTAITDPTGPRMWAAQENWDPGS